MGSQHLHIQIAKIMFPLWLDRFGILSPVTKSLYYDTNSLKTIVKECQQIQRTQNHAKMIYWDFWLTLLVFFTKSVVTPIYMRNRRLNFYLKLWNLSHWWWFVCVLLWSYSSSSINLNDCCLFKAKAFLKPTFAPLKPTFEAKQKLNVGARAFLVV